MVGPRSGFGSTVVYPADFRAVLQVTQPQPALCAHDPHLSMPITSVSLRSACPAWCRTDRSTAADAGVPRCACAPNSCREDCFYRTVLRGLRTRKDRFHHAPPFRVRGARQIWLKFGVWARGQVAVRRPRGVWWPMLSHVTFIHEPLTLSDPGMELVACRTWLCWLSLELVALLSAAGNTVTRVLTPCRSALFPRNCSR